MRQNTFCLRLQPYSASRIPSWIRRNGDGKDVKGRGEGGKEGRRRRERRREKMERKGEGETKELVLHEDRNA